MVDPMEALPERVTAVEGKLDALGARVDARFDDVTRALVEQREYTEFAFERLQTEMRAGFSAMATNFARLERKFDQLIDGLLGRRSDA